MMLARMSGVPSVEGPSRTEKTRREGPRKWMRLAMVARKSGRRAAVWKLRGRQ